MKSRLSQRLRRLTLLGLIVVGSTSPVAVTHAQELDGNSRPIAGSSDWCGWGTHDSMPLATVDAKPNSEKCLKQNSRTANRFEQSLATVAAAATAKVGVSFEQFLEPFAMLGNHQSSSIDDINRFQKWWDSALLAAQASSKDSAGPQNDADYAVVSTVKANDSNVYIPFVDFEGSIDSAVAISVPSVPDWQARDDDGFSVVGTTDLLRRSLDAVAAEEPIDANANDELNRVFAKQFVPAAPKASRNVGASPMIVTLDEAYLPYDLAVRDMPVWMPKSLASKPFCWIYSTERSLPDPMWSESVDNVDDPQNELLQASADCLLDEWVWNVQRGLESGSTLRKAMSPKTAGEGLAWLVNRGDRATTLATRLIASVWPDLPAKPAASRQLLVRADAIEASPIEQAASEQLTQTVAKIKQWWASAQAMQQDWLRIANTNAAVNQNR